MEILLEEGDDSSVGLTKFNAIGFILADRVLNRRGVVNILRGIWPETVVPFIREVNRNTIVISFVSESILNRALKGGPWSVMGYCMHLKIWTMGCSVEEVDFSNISFWIQIHKLPIELSTNKNAAVIGSKIGDVQRIEDLVGRGGFGRNFLRMKVNFKMRSPLVPGFWVPRKNSESLWVEVKYEKLSDFCYRCGCLGAFSEGV